MANKIRVGLIGANADGGSWGSRAHIPALQALPEFEIKAICTAHEESAAKAAKVFGAELAFHDYRAMVAHPDIDLVSVAVRVPYHYPIVMAAVEAGKDIYCEWPLGANLREAEEMTSLSLQLSVRTMVGLQSRSDPALTYARELMAQGYVGEVLACSLTYFSGFPGGSLERTATATWYADRTMGANTMTIQGGHAIDAMCFILGNFKEVSGRIGTRVKQWRTAETGVPVDVTSPDHILFTGVLESGAVASVHVASVPFTGSGFKLEIYGREGTLEVQRQTLSRGQSRVLGSTGDKPLIELSVPDSFTMVPKDGLDDQSYNVAQAYQRLAVAFRRNLPFDPDFEHALWLHRMLAAVEHSSADGETVSL